MLFRSETRSSGESQLTPIREEEDNLEKAEPIILPRSSYLDAVAKTWVDRSAYLESLQEGRTGVLPEYTLNDQKSFEKDNIQKKTKQSESLIDSIWNIIKGENRDERSSTNPYSMRLIRLAEKMIVVSNLVL